ncbi:FAD-dependent hydroxylase [Planktothrix sp. FACHB-1355]|uniref:FAD-dependent hydroxylase n=1 Tax=Aerosakkonema funiforme FACHB-1375 TaxID=2949571 RepID=A0A926ZG37_9CYAN|nr:MULTISPECIES: FAD-dependent hydroxylase [Oscillatoriales]MBD2180697.1 FAD-dependent hydroxylase [Aerosakkonema funiforme FACHB-1375]MBD3559529.1 FAD-dependent hydroxylase [Planktothrix sp. FACHB-1355]
MALEQLAETLSTPQLGYDCDLAIVGGGIAGLTLACALKDSGLKIILMEAKPQSVAAAKGQAYNISLLSERIFQGIGIWDKILPQIVTYRHIRLSDTDHPGVVQFYPTDLGTEALGYVAEHQVLLTCLQELAQNCPNVSWLCPAEVIKAEYQADAVELEVATVGEISKSKIRTRLLIGADGAKSRIRESAGIRTRGWQYWQSCVVATIKTEKPHNNTAFERFWPSGPTGILPLPGNRCRVVWTAPHAEAEALRVLDEKEFIEKLERRMGGLLGRLELEGSRFLFKVQLMQSDRYTLPRLALIGDAAHCCHPVGGQGINMGIRDAGALAEIIQTAHQQGKDIGDIQVLKRYESWRKRENLAILGFTDFLDRVFSNNWLPVVAMRRFGLWILRTVPPIKVYALQLMTGLRGRPPQLASRC